MREEQLLQMLKQEREDLDARLYAYKRRRLNELSERMIVRVKEDETHVKEELNRIILEGEKKHEKNLFYCKNLGASTI